MNIREIAKQDAINFLVHQKRLDAESEFLMREAGERKDTLEQKEQQIQEIIEQPNSTIYLAEQNGSILGSISIIGGKFNRIKHIAVLGLGVLAEARGQGIAKKLMKQAECWAQNHNIHRLELTVVAENTIAVFLYKKMGFEIEGVRKQCFFINDCFVDEFSMAKIIGDSLRE